MDHTAHIRIFASSLGSWVKAKVLRLKPADLAKKLYESGREARANSKYDAAIQAYQKVLGIEEPRDLVSNQPVGDHHSFAECCGQSQWELGLCYAEKQDFARAAEAFRSSRLKRPRVSWCGNGMAQFRVEAILNEGVCLERLGKQDEAVQVYFQAGKTAMLFSLPAIDRRATSRSRSSSSKEGFRGGNIWVP